ncbi:MAG: tetratricopeptide repeat protein, partial [Chloroflexota bacterium]
GPNLNQIGDRDRLYKGIAKLVSQQTQPILLVLEDLQWATESLEVLPYVIDQVKDRPLMIVGTYRKEDWPQPPNFLNEMSLIELERMSKTEISTLSQAMLGHIGAREDLVEMLYDETEGNTFFLVEVVRALGESAGTLDQISAAKLPGKMIPQGIQAIVERRLERVHPHDRDLLGSAAVAGRQLDLALLNLLNEKRPLTAWLTRCASAAMIEIQAGERWSFAHDKLREGMISSLTAEQRSGLHREVAQGLEQLYANQDDHAADLAYHWHHAGDDEKERTYALRAGHAARKQFRNDEALRYYERFLTLTPDGHLADRLDTLIACDKIYFWIVDNDKRQRYLEEIMALAKELGDPDFLAKGYLNHVSYDFATGQMKQAVDHIKKAIHFGEIADNKRVSGVAYMELSKVLLATGNIGEAVRYGRKSLEISREVGHIHQIAKTSTILSPIIWYSREPEMLDLLNTAAVYFERYDLKRWLSYCSVNLAYVYCHRGDLLTAHKFAERGYQLAQDSGAWLGKSSAYVAKAYVATAQGRYESALADYDEAVSLNIKSNDLFYLGLSYLLRGDLVFRMGNMAEAKTTYQNLLQVCQLLRNEAGMATARSGILRASQALGIDANKVAPLYADISAYLEIDPDLKNIRYPVLFCLNLYHGLIETQPEGALRFLRLGEKIILEIAAKFEDEADRQTYLNHPSIVGEVLTLLESAKIKV